MASSTPDLCTPPSTHVLQRMARRLPRNSPVRLVAMDLACDKPVLQGDSVAVLQAFRDESGERWREQELAARLIPLIPLPEDDRMEASARLIELLERRQWPEPSARGPRMFWAFVITAFLARIVVELEWPGKILEANVVFLAGCIALLFPLLRFALGGDDMGLLPVRCAAAATLGWMKVPGSVDGLTSAASHQGSGIRANRSDRLGATALCGLFRVLPELTDAHYGLLKSQTVPILAWTLIEDRSQPLRLVIMEALGKVGDGRALGPVEHISQHGRPLEREVAERILPVLRARKRQESDPKTLLRPIANDPEAADLLLRPATTAESAPDKLLRPA